MTQFHQFSIYTIAKKLTPIFQLNMWNERIWVSIQSEMSDPIDLLVNWKPNPNGKCMSEMCIFIFLLTLHFSFSEHSDVKLAQSQCFWAWKSFLLDGHFWECADALFVSSAIRIFRKWKMLRTITIESYYLCLE